MKLITVLVVSCLTWMRCYIKSVFSSGRWWLLEWLYVLYTICLFKSMIVYSTQVHLIKVQGVLQSKTPEIKLTTLSRCVSFVIATPDRMQISVPSTLHMIIIRWSGYLHKNTISRREPLHECKNVLCKWELYLPLNRPL